MNHGNELWTYRTGDGNAMSVAHGAYMGGGGGGRLNERRLDGFVGEGIGEEIYLVVGRRAIRGAHGLARPPENPAE